MFGTISFLAIAISILQSAICSTHESPTPGNSINFQHDHIKIMQAPGEPNHPGLFRNEDKPSLLLVPSNSSLSRPIRSGESVHTSRSYPTVPVIAYFKYILNLAKTRLSFLMHITSGSGNNMLQEHSTTPNLLARHVAITKSPSILLQPVKNNSTMLGEIILNSNNPLLDALSFFIDLIDDFIDSSDRVMLNILGEEPDSMSHSPLPTSPPSNRHMKSSLPNRSKISATDVLFPRHNIRKIYHTWLITKLPQHT